MIEGLGSLSVLTDLIARVRAGEGAGEAMVEAVRATALLVPRSPDGTLPAADVGGIRWLFAFTSPAELAAWTLARGGDVDGDAEQEYLTILGRRLLTVAPASADVPVGVAVDVAGAAPMLLPPMSGIVPAAFALDV